MRIMNDIERIMKESATDLAPHIFREFEEHNKNCFFAAFKRYFKDQSEFSILIERLGPHKAKIIRLGFFYYVITQEIRHAGITLIALFSIMEGAAQEKFQPFDQWLLAKIRNSRQITFPISNVDELKEHLLSFQSEYFKKHGSAERVRKFIGKYFSHEDKENLIGKFQIKDETVGFASLEFEEKIRVIVDMLYNERNAFVHQGRLPQLTDGPSNMLGYFKIRNTNTYVDIQISIKEIEGMFERAFIKFLEE